MRWTRRWPNHPDNGDVLHRRRAEGRRRARSRLLRRRRADRRSPAMACAAVQSGLATKAPPNKQIRRGAVVRVVKSASGALGDHPTARGRGRLGRRSTRATAPIRALVGGFDFDKNKFNHVTQAWRQPGSSFKPFIYSAALEKGFTPGHRGQRRTAVLRRRRHRRPALGAQELRRPVRRPDDDAHGLAKSKNMISIRVLQTVGPAYAQEWVTRSASTPTSTRAYLTMALGAGSVTPLPDGGAATAVFANGGLPRQAVPDHAGSPTHRPGDGARPPAGAGETHRGHRRRATPS